MEQSEKLDVIIAELESYVALLGKAQKEYVINIKNYNEKKSRLWLETDFAEVLEKGRPTVDEKKAYVTSQTLTEKTDRDNAYYNIQYIKSKIDVCYAKLEILSRDV